MLRCLCVNENHTDVKYHEKRIEDYCKNLCEFGPILLHSVQGMQWIGQYGISLMPLYEIDNCDCAQKEVDDIRGGSVPNPLLITPLICDDTPNIRDDSDHLDH